MVKVIGHRGAAGELPENTLKGFRYAVELGVDLVECDVHLTRDGRLVVMHDSTVDRTTNGHGAIHDLSFERIRSLDAGEGEQVPTLDEVLAVVRGRVVIEVELKGSGVEDAAVETVVAHDMADQVIFTSFSMERLARVRQLGDHYRIGAIVPNPTEFDFARAIELGAEAIAVQYKHLCYRIVDQAREAGLELRAWNPDTLAEQQAMIALGAEVVSTNLPTALLAYLRGAPSDSQARKQRKLPKRRRNPVRGQEEVVL